MTTLDRIVIDPAICHGKPVIRGLRVPVSVVVAASQAAWRSTRSSANTTSALTTFGRHSKFAGELIEQELFHPLPAG